MTLHFIMVDQSENHLAPRGIKKYIGLQYVGRYFSCKPILSSLVLLLFFFLLLLLFLPLEILSVFKCEGSYFHGYLFSVQIWPPSTSYQI